MQRPLGVQIAHMLAGRGVETVFGIPGVHNVEMYRGIAEAGLTHVLARHEQGAGFMADGYARATGQPGVCFVITGPGLTNVMTPMGQAWSDGVPMLVISSCLDETAARKGQLHQMRDQRAAAATVCDWSEEAKTPEAAYSLIDRALAEFAEGRGRPRHIQVPISVLGAPAPAAPMAAGPLMRMTMPFDLEGEVLPYLRGARRPLFVFGGGTRSLLGPGLVDRLGAASFTTCAGRGLIPADAPLHFGSYLARPGSAEVAASADLVIAIGTELSEVDLWRDRLGNTAPMIRVDIDPAVLADAHRAEVPIRADSHDFMMALWNATEDWEPATGWTEDEVATARARWRAEVDAERPGIVPLCDVLRAALPKDTVICSDMTQLAYAANEVWDLAAPGLWHHPSGFGTLGYALPAAIGAKAGLGDMPVAAIAGDYGFQYTVQELGTAVELGLSLPILLWDNAALKEIEDCMTGAQIPPNAVHAHNPDFLALARAYGARAAEPRGAAEIRAAIETALRANGPTVIRLTPNSLG